MISIIKTGLKTALWAIILAITAGCAEQQALKNTTPSATANSASNSVAEPTEARDILMRMAKFLANTPRFTVNLNDNYEVLQNSGQMIEFGENRTIQVNRPNGLHVEVEQSDGDKQVLIYDGKEITVFSPMQNVYAQTAKSGGIDEAVVYFLKDLHMRMPLAALLLSRLPDELDRRTQSLDYVEKTVIDGASAHHLAGRTETVDYQVWIAAGSQPLPLRIVLNYKNAEGHPAFRAHFSDWNLTPEINENAFIFTPPEGARKITFLAELPQIAIEGTTNPDQTGGQK